MAVFYDFVDTYAAYVDKADMSTKYVDIFRFRRHIFAMCRLKQHMCWPKVTAQIEAVTGNKYREMVIGATHCMLIGAYNAHSLI